MDWLGVKEYLKDTIGYFITFILILLFVIYVIGLGQVMGPSMKNKIDNGDIIVVSKIHYKLTEVKRGDIIAFDFKGNKFLIKRIVGLPNEKIEIIDSKIYIDDKILEEDYIISSEIKDKDYGKIPSDSYFVLGDNRSDSLDSRNFGFINKSDIIGKVIFKIFPFTEISIVK